MQVEDIINWQDLAPSDYSLFGSMKEDLRGKHSAHTEEMKTSLMKSFKEQST